MTSPITPTSPKKRSLMPSSALRRTLRGHGHRLSAIVQVGKAGVSDGLVKQVEQALADHELVKLKVGGEGPSDRFEVAERLAALPGVNIVQIVGGAILLYRRHPSEPRYEGQRAPAASQPSPRAAAPSAKADPAQRRSGKANGSPEKKKPDRRPDRRGEKKPARARPGAGVRARVRARRS
jgi:RNA-binding protein